MNFKIDSLLDKSLPKLEYIYYKGHEVLKANNIEEAESNLLELLEDSFLISKDEQNIEKSKVVYEYSRNKFIEYGGEPSEYPEGFGNCLAKFSVNKRLGN